MSQRDEERDRGDRRDAEGGGRPRRQGGAPRRESGGYRGRGESGGYRGRGESAGYRGRGESGGYRGRGESAGYRGRGESGGRDGGSRSSDRGRSGWDGGAARGAARGGGRGRADGPRWSDGPRDASRSSGGGREPYGGRGETRGRDGRGRTSDRGGYGRPRPDGGREARESGRDRTRDDRYGAPRSGTRPPRRWSEPGIGDDETFGTEGGRSFARAASTGRNLWNPTPAAARRGPARPGNGRQGGAVRRSTNTVGGEQVEGRQAVRELLAAGSRPVSEVWMLEGSDPSPILGEIDNLARSAHVPVRVVSPRRLESVQRTETPQGVVAFAEPLRSYDLVELVMGAPSPLPPGADTASTTGSETVAGAVDDDATSKVGPAGGRPGRSGTGAAFLVVVDGVTDPQNLGAVLRSAECAGATGAVLPRHRAVHVTAAVTKAAAGAVEHLPIALVAGIPSALQTLEDLGVRTIGLDERGETSVFELGLDEEPVALVLGAEGRGLSPLSRRRCSELASIPLHGSIPSLNVSTAAAVACFEVARRRTARS